MQSLDILLVGDIHYPQAKFDLDYKDTSVSRSFAESTAPSSLRVVIQKIVEVAGTTDAAFICGDLTSWGSVRGYEECVDWLDQNLQLNAGEFWPRDRVHIVPGNHDLDRNKCELAAPDPYAKFAPYEAVLDSHGMKDLLALREVRSTAVKEGHRLARLISLNSCYGCGEFRSLNEKVRTTVFSAISDSLKSTSDHSKEVVDEKLKEVLEQLDSPSFLRDDIETLLNTLDALERNEVPLILGHHNILPQRTSRVDLYSELLNSGAFRSELAAHRSPIIYAHGHIHQDPVEVVSLPGSDSSPLICVSASELRFGFSILRLHYGRKRQALGLEVVPYKTCNGHTKCEQTTPVRVPFWKATDLVEKCSSNAVKVFSNSIFDGKTLRFRDIERGDLSELQLSDSLLELEWLGLVRIDNRALANDHWQVAGVN